MSTPIGDAALEIMKDRGAASFPEILRGLRERGYQPGGDAVMLLAGNLVLWTGLSGQLADALGHMLDAGTAHLIVLTGKDIITFYGMDGQVPAMPLCRRKPPAGGYRRPHWLAVAWNPGPGGGHGPGSSLEQQLGLAGGGAS
jgi:hypothetical protein